MAWEVSSCIVTKKSKTTIAKGTKTPKSSLTGRTTNPRRINKMSVHLERILRPINAFLSNSTSGGIVLLIVTVVALVWANSAPESYQAIWNAPGTLTVGKFSMTHTIGEWINDGLLAIFFLQVGLEIKRETKVGDLSTFGQAILPVAAVFFNDTAATEIYTLCNINGPYLHGWGIPTATDIAFALGVISLLGKRVPTSLKIFLGALAVADDLGAVLVIALFYNSNIKFTALIVALLIYALLYVLNRMGVRSLVVYAIGGIFLWLGVLHSGVHASLAGVMLATTIPVWTYIDRSRFRSMLIKASAALEETPDNKEGTIGDKKLISILDSVHKATSAANPPLIVMEHSITTFVTFFIMPVFALANSGVIITKLDPGFLQDPVTHGIFFGLVLGKPLGISLATYLVIKFKLAELPRLATWPQLIGVSMLGGIGFTMALFVSGLALGEGSHLNTAKLAILCASTTAGLLGFIWLYLHPMSPEAAEQDNH